MLMAAYFRFNVLGQGADTSCLPFVGGELLTLAEKLLSRIEKTDSCWIWRGAVNSQGYGNFRSPSLDGRLAHRICFEVFTGQKLGNLHLHHSCNTPLCVNPEHLHPVTPGEHLMLGNTINKRYLARIHCKKGHEFTAENTFQRTDGGRGCRACYRIRDARKQQAKVSQRQPL